MLHEVDITLYRNVLVHHIAQVAFKEGFVINTGDDKTRSDVQDVASDDDTINRLTLSLASAWGDVKAALAKFIKHEDWDEDGETSSDTLTTPDVYSVTLIEGEWFPKPVIDSVTRAMHDYMVNFALAQWFAITKPEKVQYYEGQAAEALNKAVDYVNRDYGPLQVKAWPPF